MKPITELFLRALRKEAAGTVIHDPGGLRGKVRSTVKGMSVSFVYRYRSNGTTREVSCGTWPRDSLANIRKKRDTIKAAIVNGSDPALERAVERLRRHKERVQHADDLRAEIAALQSRQTVADCLTRWRQLNPVKREAERERLLEHDVIPVIGNLPAEEVARRHITAIVDGIIARGAPVMAGQCLSTLRTFFRWAKSRDLVKSDPTEGIPKPQAKERDRVLSESEIIELHRLLPLAHLDVRLVHCVWALLATCARSGELMAARWEHVDFTGRTWRIPETKNGKAHTIYLSDFAAAHFETLHAYLMGDRVAPFTPTRLATDILNRQKGTRRVSAEAVRLNLPGGTWTAHDLRRTGATMMGRLGVDPHVIERCLNHTDPVKVRRIYQRQELEGEQRDAWSLLGARLTEICR